MAAKHYTYSVYKSIFRSHSKGKNCDLPEHSLLSNVVDTHLEVDIGLTLRGALTSTVRVQATQRDTQT